MSGATRGEPTKEELDALPFDFTNLDVYFDDDLPTNRIQYASWHGREVRKPFNKPWIFEDDLQDIKAEDWEEHYPGRIHGFLQRQICPLV
jgi:hypothetical protein